MTDHEQNQPATVGIPQNSPIRWGYRRRFVLIGTGGAAVILAGSGLIATQMHESRQQSLPEPAAVTPIGTPQQAFPVPASPTATHTAPPTSAGTRSSAREDGDEHRKTQSSPATKTPEQVREEIAKARAKAAADGVPLKRPLKQQRVMSKGLSQRTEQTENGTIRVTTARDDLTGKGPLAIAADEGTPVGSAHCTNKIRFSAAAPAQERPTLVLCWRTSEQRSVVTMAVTPKGKPNAAESVALIEREWKKLG